MQTDLHVRASALMLLAMVLSGCTAPRGIQRTPWVGWETRTFKQLGIAIDLPSQPSDSHRRYTLKVADSETYVRNTGYRGSLFVGFHPAWAGSYLVEPVRAVSVVVHRVPFSLFEEAGRPFCPAIQTEEFRKADVPFPMSSISLTRHVKAPDGDVLLIHAVFRKAPDSESGMDDDLKAVRHIVGSVRPLP